MRNTVALALVCLMGLTIVGILVSTAFSWITVDEAGSLAAVLLSPLAGITGFAVAYTLARQSS